MWFSHGFGIVSTVRQVYGSRTFGSVALTWYSARTRSPFPLWLLYMT